MRVISVLFVSSLSFMWVVFAPWLQDTGRSQEQASSADEIFTTRTSYQQLILPPDEDAFQFAIYGDRTSGVPAGLKVLEQAVVDTNVIGPDLVMTVGDLVQGYNKSEQWLQEKDEYKAIMNRLDCRWFPVAGNHDVYWDQKDKDAPAGQHEANYEKHFGPLWYSFKHKQSGFLVLYTDEGDSESNKKGFNSGFLQTMSEEQLNFLKQALNGLKDCEHVFVFLHHPRWIGGGYEGGNWEEVHQIMKTAGNVSAVFAGHIHHMRFDGKRDGIEYYALATTGGNLSADFPDAGYLHHFNLVTVRPNGIHVATLPVGSVVDPKQFTQDYLTELHKVQEMRPQLVENHRLPVDSNGHVFGKYELSFSNPSQIHDLELDIQSELPPAWQIYPAHIHLNVPKGETVSTKFRFLRDPNSQLLDDERAEIKFERPKMFIRAEMLMENVRIRVPEVEHPIELELADAKGLGSVNRCLVLADIDSSSPQGIPIFSEQFELPQGPFTLEAWVNPVNNEQSRGIVAKTQSSEYALFSHEGKPSFDVFLNGKYAHARSSNPLPLNQWTHVAGVFDGSELRLYLNGKLVDKKPASGKRKTNQLPLYVGADPDGRGNPVRSFAGMIDEVRLSVGAVYQQDFAPELRSQLNKDTILLFQLDDTVGPFVYESGNGRLFEPAGSFRLTERN